MPLVINSLNAMLSKYVLVAWLVVSSMTAQAADIAPNKPLVVVASFSIVGDLVQQLGGEQVELHVLVGPNSDGHVYQPTPADARLLKTADLVVINGLGFEGWLTRLLAAAEYHGMLLTATDGITPLMTGHGHEPTPDPHAWQDLANIRIYLRNIYSALVTLAPQHSAAFTARHGALLADIDALEVEVHTLLATIAPEQRSIVTSHDAFGYFGHAYGLHFLAPIGLSTDSEASASDVAALIQQIRTQHIGAVFVENITDRRLLERIASETGARIGGTLYSDALSEPMQPASTYVAMMRHNLRTLVRALNVTARKPAAFERRAAPPDSLDSLNSLESPASPASPASPQEHHQHGHH
jgi:zinc/manganese transport system substrate-binding protein